MTDIALSALAAALTTTVLATSLLAAALGLAQIWDSEAYLVALPRALSIGL